MLYNKVVLITIILTIEVLLLLWFGIDCYYTALLDALECSIHLNEPFQCSVINYFRVIDRY